MTADDDGPLAESTRTVAMVRIGAGAPESRQDLVAREEPLELQIGATSLAVIMRTPGHDEELALGFLATERVIVTRADVLAIAHHSVVADPAGEDNILRVHLRPGVRVDLDALRRNVYATASCGICGKASIALAMRSAPPLEDATRLAPSFFAGLPAQLRAFQTGFDATGGLHAAALVAGDGAVLVVREDVGRHNAVDKVIGWAATHDRLPLAGHVLLVSGRISFEIAQKALAAGCPVVAAVSAPSSLAIELAEAAHLLLIGFLRDGGCNAYGDLRRLRT